MRPSHILSAVASTLFTFGGTVFGLPVADSQVLQRRQSQVISLNGSIIAPTAGTIISSNGTFPFSYKPYDLCHESYSGITIWLVPGPDPPTPASLNATQAFPPEEYLNYYGDWLISDFGVPTLPPGPPPEAFTAAPAPDSPSFGSTAYIAVVETSIGCPPLGQTVYTLTSVGVTYTD